MYYTIVAWRHLSLSSFLSPSALPAHRVASRHRGVVQTLREARRGVKGGTAARRETQDNTIPADSVYSWSFDPGLSLLSPLLSSLLSSPLFLLLSSPLLSSVILYSSSSRSFSRVLSISSYVYMNDVRRERAHTHMYIRVNTRVCGQICRYASCAHSWACTRDTYLYMLLSPVYADTGVRVVCAYTMLRAVTRTHTHTPACMCAYARVYITASLASCTCSFRARVSRAQKLRARASSRSRMLGMRSPRSTANRDRRERKSRRGALCFVSRWYSCNLLVIPLERTAEDSPDTDRDHTRINYAARFIGQQTASRPACAELRYFHEVPSA